MSEAQAARARVLMVDDDADMRVAVTDNLEVLGYPFAQAATAAEALALVKQGDFDVILMDYTLPDSNGIEAIRRIRGLNSQAEIVMLTGRDDFKSALEAIHQSVYDYIIKPAAFDDIRRAVDRAFDKKHLQDENRRLIAQLEASNLKLEKLNSMKSKFLSMASHDLANSLMALGASFELLCMSIPAPLAEQKKRMDSISTGIKQIAGLINDLVDWASIEKGRLRVEFEPVDPKEILEAALPGPAARAKAKGISVKSFAPPGLPPIRADKRRLIQVLNNLLENAIRHTPKDGEIEVRLESAAAGGVVFRVRDTGEGIAPEEVSRIFESFYQAESRSGAGRLGLGLSISKEIIDAHKGRIWAESRGRDLGASFVFSVPGVNSTNA